MSTDAGEAAGLTVSAQERLDALFSSHADRLYRLARRLAPGSDEALDLVQDTFLKVARTAARIPHGRTAEEAWLVRILVNLRRDQWRKGSVRRRLAPLLWPAAAPAPERAYQARLDVWQALDTIAPRRRAILVMHELEGLPVPAIASLLGIAAITVRWHLARARRDLAQRLHGYQGASDEHAHTHVAGRGSGSARGPAGP
jgi:RNA polymerase sigma-70 factor (ECF subfamily)